MDLVRILIVDDFYPWRCLIQSVLMQSLEFEIVGLGADGLQAIHMSAELQPDVVLLDIGLPKLNGFAAARKIQEVSPGSKIVFLSTDGSQAILREAHELGAQGFVSKLDIVNGLIPAVRNALAGKLA